MDGSLVELAQRFVPVGETGLHPRRHEAAADERSRGRKRKPYAGQARSGRDRTPRRRFSRSSVVDLCADVGLAIAAVRIPGDDCRSLRIVFDLQPPKRLRGVRSRPLRAWPA